MAAANGSPLIEPYEDPVSPGIILELQLSRTAKSGFKGVTNTSGTSWQARMMIDGKLHHVHSSRKPRDCAIRLAWAERFKTAWDNGEMARYEAEEEKSKKLRAERTEELLRESALCIAQLDALIAAKAAKRGAKSL